MKSNQPVRVLHVFGIMNRGGAETLVMNIFRHIDKEKVMFDFLVHKEAEGAFEEEIRALGGIVHRIKYVPDVGHFGYIKELRCFFAAHPEYKFVHSHIDQMSGLVLREAHKVGIPVRIAHSHSIDNGISMAEKTYKRCIQMMINSNATQRFACSNSAAKWLFRKKGADTLVIKNAIDTERFTFDPSIRETVRNALGIPSGHFAVGHVGSFTPQKNHAFLTDVFQELHRQNEDTILFLVGEGYLKEKIKNKVNQMELGDCVRFLGVRDDIPVLLQGFDAFLFPSLYEGFGIAVIEAQAAGVPSVISDKIPEEVILLPEIVRRENLSSTSAQWADAVRNMIGKRAEGTSETVKRKGYDIRETAALLERFYAERSKDL